MDFQTTPEQEQFRTELRGWLEEALPDGWLEGERDVPDDRLEREQFLRDWQRKLYDGGWAGLAWPEEYGGQGASLMEQVIYEQEMARADAPFEPLAAGLDFVGPTLIEVGTEEQQERFLENILKGEEMWCQGYSEPGAGSDLASLQLSAEDDGDQFVLNGEKTWTSGAHMADWIFLLARTDTSGPKHHGITVLLVDMDTDGVTQEPIRGAADEYHFSQVFFDDAIVPKENVVGEQDDGWRVAMTLSSYERTTSTAFRLERRWQDVAAYCKTHTRNGAPLSEDPVVRQRLAELDTKIQAAKLTYLRNVSRQIKEGKPSAAGIMDNVYGRELAQELERFAIGLRGPNTARWESSSVSDWHPGFPLNDARQDTGKWTNRYVGSFSRTVGGGTAEIKRNLIAERVLGLPKGLRGE